MDEYNDLELKLINNYLPVEYRFLEWRLIINRELYENNIIDLKIFSLIETSLINKMTKIKKDILKNISR